jgi:hypothetical protein
MIRVFPSSAMVPLYRAVGGVIHAKNYPTISDGAGLTRRR